VNHAEARAKVVEYLKTIPPCSRKDRWIIVDEKTINHELFWMFCWTTARALWPRRRTIPLAGNYPIAVSKDDGRMYMWTLVYPFEEFVERFRRQDVPEVGATDPDAGGSAESF
jgi:hypothetical protein